MKGTKRTPILRTAILRSFSKVSEVHLAKKRHSRCDVWLFFILEYLVQPSPVHGLHLIACLSVYGMRIWHAHLYLMSVVYLWVSALNLGVKCCFCQHCGFSARQAFSAPHIHELRCLGLGSANNCRIGRGTPDLPPHQYALHNDTDNITGCNGYNDSND